MLEKKRRQRKREEIEKEKQRDRENFESKILDSRTLESGI